jgi:hypothetical protein
MRWHSIHVHYYHADLDGLVLDAVRPLFAAVAGEVTGAYFVRHWRQGPHLRLNLRADPRRFDSRVRPTAERMLRDYLIRRPSRAAPDPHRLLPLHRRLAAMERETGPLLPWRPDNSVHVARYDPRVAVLGSEVAAELQADFLTASTGSAFEMIDHIRAGGQRPRIAFDLLIAIGHALGGGIAQGAVSYRSHAESFLATEPTEPTGPDGADQPGADPDRRRAAWDQHYRQHAPSLVDRVRRVVAAVDGTGPPVPFVREWVDLLSGYRDRARPLLANGALPAPAGPEPDPPSRLWRSEFHRALATNDDYQRRVRHSLGFRLWRLVLNYTYLQLTRVGLTPSQRFLVCHLAAGAVEDAYGVSALRRLDALTQSAA